MKTTDHIRRPYGLLWLLPFILGGCSSGEPVPQPEPPLPNPPEPTTCTFEVRVSDLSPSGAKVRIVPEKENFPYCFAVVDEDDYARAEGKAQPIVEALVAETMNADPALSRAEAVERIRRTGTLDEAVEGLAAESAYFAMAVGIDDKGECSTAPAFERFATAALPYPTGGFTVRVSGLEATRATVSVTPDNDDMDYYYDVVTAEDYAGCGGDLSVIIDELIQSLLKYNQGKTVEDITAAIRSKGPAGDTVGPLPPSTDFYAFAIGVADDGTCFTEATVEPFRTLDPGDPKDCTFAITFEQQASTSILVKVTPSDETIGYFTAIVPFDEYGGDANLIARIRQGIVEIAAQEHLEVADAVEILAWRGISSEFFEGLEPSTDYYAFAYALASDASAAGPLFKERFTTLGENSSTAAVTVSIDKYFDGTELEQAYPDRYAGYSGKVCVLVRAQPSDDAEHWYAALGNGDMTDPTFYPEETTVNALLQGGTPDKREMRYVGRWGDATLLGVAADAYYQFGKVFREFVELKQENAAPVEEFVPEAVSLPLSEGILVRPAGPALRSVHDPFRLGKRIRNTLPTARRADRLFRR